MEPESISSENLTKELAYLLGVYLTDGSFNSLKSKNGFVHHNFQLQVIDRDFAETTLECWKKLIPTTKATIREYSYPPQGFSSKLRSCRKYAVGLGATEWYSFFINQTGRKHHIPYIIWDAPRYIQKWFVAGVMDGDGWITYFKDRDSYRCGCGSVDGGWIWEFKRLIQSLGCRVGKDDIDRKGNIPVVRIHINADSFVSSGLFFTIGRKQERIRKLIEKRKEEADYRTLCPECGIEFCPPRRCPKKKFCSNTCSSRFHKKISKIRSETKRHPS